MQHVNFKIFVRNRVAPRFEDAIPVFHRWIQTQAVPELLVDVADYSHVPAGPGVVLVGYEADYALDNARNQPGLLYNRRARSEAPPAETLRQAYEAARSAAELLAAEPEFASKLEFDYDTIELTFNDRLLHPNSDAGWSEVEGDVHSFFDEVYGAGGYTLTRATDPRERLRVTVRRQAIRSN